MSELRDGMPEEIRVLIGRCEIGHVNFSNDEMSAALHFGETCWRELCNFKDPTPLSELTDDQWRAEGFKARYGLHHDFQVWGSEDSNWIHWCKSHGVTVNGRPTESIKTLGQLRHLIAALGDNE